MELGENIRKLLLAGIGTAAVTVDKSKEILDDLVKKGELTVEQGKVLNHHHGRRQRFCAHHGRRGRRCAHLAQCALRAQHGG